jgi:8-oxo-dGTP pyrophosphatase MutT (NUDIX family)
MSDAIERPGVRIVVFDDENRVLLFRYLNDGHTFWATPGGRVEAGETHEQAAERELQEEVGLEDAPVCPLNWTREHVWTWDWNGEMYASRERFFVAHVPSGVATQSPGLGEGEVIHESRWWSLAEIEQAQANGTDISPRQLAEHLRSLLADGPPDEPVDVGV